MSTQNDPSKKSSTPAPVDAFAIGMVLLVIAVAIVFASWAFDSAASLTIVPTDYAAP